MTDKMCVLSRSTLCYVMLDSELLDQQYCFSGPKWFLAYILIEVRDRKNPWNAKRYSIKWSTKWGQGQRSRFLERHNKH